MSLKLKIVFTTLISLAVFGATNHQWIKAGFAAGLTNGKCDEADIEIARKPASKIFGTLDASPIIACTSDPKIGIEPKFAAVYFAPLLPAIILFGPNGQNLDVMAHELVHAELAHRSSALLRTYKIPSWFDEGLAMQVDNRTPYTQVALARYRDNGKFQNLKLTDFDSIDAFIPPKSDIRLPYAFSKCVVSYWLKGKKPGTALNFVSEISWLNSFPVDEFQEAEAWCSSASKT